MDMELPKQRILIVDDVPSNIKILGEALKDDYKVSIAVNGQGALDIADSDSPPDLILLDIIMPGMDGYEVCRKLKNKKNTRNIPIIFITSKDQEEDETKGLEAGAVDYITKPFSLPIVKARTRTHLELKMQRDMLEELSAMDPLTRLPNRRRFQEFSDLEWKRSVRANKQLSLLLIDVDFFKNYNDTYGHPAGDQCLRKVAQALAGALKRSTDLVARFGGEEFAVVLPDTDPEGAGFMAEEMRAKVEALDIEHGNSVVGDVVTISIGGATVTPTPQLQAAALMAAADKALYQAKETGRNRVVTQEL